MAKITERALTKKRGVNKEKWSVRNVPWPLIERVQELANSQCRVGDIVAKALMDFFECDEKGQPWED